MKAYLGHGTDYTGEQVEVKTTEVPRGWRRADGYGSRIPTRYMVRYNNRWRRVYAICWSNAASYYIGGKGDAPRIFLTIWKD